MMEKAYMGIPRTERSALSHEEQFLPSTRKCLCQVSVNLTLMSLLFSHWCIWCNQVQILHLRSSNLQLILSVELTENCLVARREKLYLNQHILFGKVYPLYNRYTANTSSDLKKQLLMSCEGNYTLVRQFDFPHSYLEIHSQKKVKRLWVHFSLRHSAQKDEFCTHTDTSPSYI